MTESMQSSGQPRNVSLWAYGYDDHDTIGLRSLGFWLYMMSDLMIFAGLFVAHRAYIRAYAGSHFTAQSVIEPLQALWPTGLILGSVLAFGLAMVSLKHANRRGVLGWMLGAFILGLAFIGVEVGSFVDLAERGGLPSVSGFLSDYWTIVLAHAAHVAFGLLWMLIMWLQVATEGFSELVVARLINLRIFWFFQASIWLCVYAVVYLLGVA
ncbi:cytochrome O ubiquinol oxidase [Salinisphaera sp. USBA-960]|nr:cytochrome O ubiquinol oxidase [Salifodinibacter halophilus]NNC27028.1 cytochrome O ubiquinol oxidase [Salifodinibacter halophilus]